MKIQIAAKKIIDDALVVWPWGGTDEVDVIMDPRLPDGMRFRPGSVNVIYAFHIFGLASPDDTAQMAKNIFDLLPPGGQVYIVENDFEYLCRSIVGGDLKVAEFNDNFRQECYFNQDTIVKTLERAGFPQAGQRVWIQSEPLKFQKQHYEFIISGTKPELK